MACCEERGVVEDDGLGWLCFAFDDTHGLCIGLLFITGLVIDTRSEGWHLLGSVR